jgi:hypothetical protein
MTLARHFNAGDAGAWPPSPAGTADRTLSGFRIANPFVRKISAVPAGLDPFPAKPGVETPGYYRVVPVGLADDAAPLGLMIYLRVGFYKDAAPTVLPLGALEINLSAGGGGPKDTATP